MYCSERIVFCFFLTMTLSLLQITNQSNAGQQSKYLSESTSNYCFRQYLDSITNATKTYAAIYENCIEMGTRMRVIYTLEKQSAKEDVLSDQAAICTRLRNCNEILSDMDFFQCNTENGLANIADLIAIKLNSSEAIVDLDDKYDDTEQEVLLCIIQLEQNYIQDATAAYKELMLCLKDMEK